MTARYSLLISQMFSLRTVRTRNIVVPFRYTYRCVHVSLVQRNIPKAEELLDQFAQGNDKGASVTAKRQAYLNKYNDKLREKIAKEGFKSVDDMAASKRAAEAKVCETQRESESHPGTSVEARDDALREKLSEKRRATEKSKLMDDSGSPSPVQPLSSFMKLEKVLHETPDNIGKLWAGFHIMKNKVSAVVPAATYVQMIVTAKKFPQFVLPLPRAVKNEAGNAENGYEIYYLQWVSLPKPKEASSNAPPPMAVLFTPLAEYKLRQEYAQPTLVLTHYTELLESKGIALMRGDITESENGKVHVQQQDAQLLALGLQRFYNLDWALEGLDNDEEAEKRRALLRSFYERPEVFKLEDLIELAWSV